MSDAGLQDVIDGIRQSQDRYDRTGLTPSERAELRRALLKETARRSRGRRRQEKLPRQWSALDRWLAILKTWSRRAPQGDTKP